MTMSHPPVGPDAVAALVGELMVVVRAHYLRRALSRETAKEALNALAVTAAFIIAGARECGQEDEARSFFELAMDNQLDDMEQHHVQGPDERGLH